jgi:hypothetical protein
MPDHWKISNRRLFFNLIGFIILLGGLGGAILIYRSAGNNLSNDLIYQEEGGSVYPIRPEDSKKYIRDLELYGGRANVLVTEFRLWLVGLWQGESLAFIIAFITILVAAGLFYVANNSPSRSKTNQGQSD